MSNFQRGDIVRLKSGGPEMTVTDIGKYDYIDEDRAKCQWFDGNNLKEKVFDFYAIEKSEREQN